ncbi:hypothetical protein [Halorubrum sp. LN27]|uniref:hypothetical protein n=1 Tax=Halorubrum sp. LN27 TaxID=2801032 RepID=UPI00190DE745|nr:hypothetical protein [Halorubrum sp. LN27]
MSAAQGSTAFVVVTGAVTLVTAGGFWYVFDEFLVSLLVAQDGWGNGSVYAAFLRDQILKVWEWSLLIVLLRMGFEVLIAARLSRSSGALLPETLVMLIILLGLVIWAYALPQMLDPIVSMALDSTRVAEAGFDRGVQLMADLAYSYGPGLFGAIALTWYLVSPIRRDVFRGRV